MTETTPNNVGWLGPVASDSELMERLDINIISIVLGALGYIVIVSIVDLIRSACVDVLTEDDDTDNVDRYRNTINEMWTVIVTTLVAMFIGILIYMWYRHYYGGLDA